jgi:hypothetical protein
LNSTHFQTLEICQNLSFVCRLKHKVYWIEIWHTYRIHLQQHSDFFSNFFEAEKHSFQIFEKNELHRGRALKRVSGKDSMISMVCKTRDENSKKNILKYYKYKFHAYFSIFYVSTLSFAKTDIFVACVKKRQKKVSHKDIFLH